MGGIILTCGHEDHKKHMGWPLYSLTYNEFGDKAIMYASYCTSCACSFLQTYPQETFLTWGEAECAFKEWENEQTI